MDLKSILMCRVMDITYKLKVTTNILMNINTLIIKILKILTNRESKRKIKKNKAINNSININSR